MQTQGIWFASNGFTMYITSGAGARVYKYTLGTAWDVTTASEDDYYPFAESSDPIGIWFNADGSKLFMLGVTEKEIFQYGNTGAYNVDLSYDNVSLNLLPSGTPSGVFFNGPEPALPSPRNQYRAFIADPDRDLIICHSEDTWDLRTNYVNSDDISAEETNVRGIFFKVDGLKSYIVGLTNATIYQYVLTTKFDLSTMSYDSKSFDVSTYDINPMELFFRSDGAQAFMVGFDTATIYRFELTTAWDISTAAFSDNYFSVAAQDTSPTGLFITPDGLTVYVSGTDNNLIYKYALSVPGDLSKAEYTDNYYDVTAQAGSPRGIFFDDDLTRLFVVDWNTGRIYQYSI